MGNSRIVSIIVWILLLCGMGMVVVIGYQKKEAVRIATCPTFWDVIYKMDVYQWRKTQSTSESLYLLKHWYVDYVLAGRTPKPWEFDWEYKVVWSWYSFLHKESITIYDKELQTMKFYTDLEETENIKKIFWIKYVEKVENIYEYLNDSIVITSWKNTDYSKADIVHVLYPNWERYIESRIPILYCREQCDEGIVSTAKKFYSINKQRWENY